MSNERDEEAPRSFVKFLADLGDGFTARDDGINKRTRLPIFFGSPE